MSFIADTHNNPFHVDDVTLPPQRSAFAVLGVNRDELRGIGIEAAYERARRRLDSDSEFGGVYGRSLHEDDLRMAQTRLEEPGNRVVNELLDFHFEPYQLDDMEELAEILDAFRAALAVQESPRVEDPSLIARILSERVALMPAPTLPPLRTGRPELPELDRLLGD